jgi:hypothetical protein
MITLGLRICIEESYEKVYYSEIVLMNSWLSEFGWTTSRTKEAWSCKGSKNANLGETLVHCRNGIDLELTHLSAVEVLLNSVDTN